MLAKGVWMKFSITKLSHLPKALGIKLALENLSYTSTGFGKNVELLEEVLGVIDDGDMGITFDFCHALETRQVDNLLDKYGERVCNVHMADKAHEPFTEPKPELIAFLTRLHEYRYEGPITLELAHNTSMKEIEKARCFLIGFLKNFSFKPFFCGTKGNVVFLAFIEEFFDARL